jgi:hypothetical protein
MRFAETLLVGLDEGAVGALFRAAVGFVISPAVAAVMGRAAGDWALVPGVAVIVILLRLVPLVIRRLVPFSSRAQEIWRNRRPMAKTVLDWRGYGAVLGGCGRRTGPGYGGVRDMHRGRGRRSCQVARRCAAPAKRRGLIRRSNAQRGVDSAIAWSCRA